MLEISTVNFTRSPCVHVHEQAGLIWLPACEALAKVIKERSGFARNRFNGLGPPAQPRPNKSRDDRPRCAPTHRGFPVKRNEGPPTKAPCFESSALA